MPEQGGLAGPGRAEQRDHLPGPDGQVDPAQRGHLGAGRSVDMHQVVTADRERRRPCWPPGGRAAEDAAGDGGPPDAGPVTAQPPAAGRAARNGPAAGWPRPPRAPARPAPPRAAGPGRRGAAGSLSGGACGWLMNSGTLRTASSRGRETGGQPDDDTEAEHDGLLGEQGRADRRRGTRLASSAAYSYRRRRPDAYRPVIAAPAASAAAAAASARNSTVARAGPWRIDWAAARRRAGRAR